MLTYDTHVVGHGSLYPPKLPAITFTRKQPTPPTFRGEDGGRAGWGWWARQRYDACSLFVDVVEE